MAYIMSSAESGRSGRGEIYQFLYFQCKRDFELSGQREADIIPDAGAAHGDLFLYLSDNVVYD